jgi:hypothetical protein
MTATRSTVEIDELMERASQSLRETDYFEAERLADAALKMAHQAHEYERMSKIILPLQESRRQRYQRALDVGKVKAYETPVTEETKAKAGCWVVQPPLVGADARRLRLLALEQRVNAAVICREPRTQAGLTPVVAVGGGLTVRARIMPPKSDVKPDMAWFVEAMEQLGDAAIDSIDPTMEITRRVSAVLDRVDAVPEHEELLQVLEGYCREAAAERAAKLKKKAMARSQA